jgi:CheY-like chemotaxis protein
MIMPDAEPASTDDPSTDGHVVVIDDYAEHLEVLLAYLARAGIPAIGFTQPREAIRNVLRHPPALVVANLYMPDMDGIEISRTLRKSLPDVPVMGITGSHDARADAYLGLLSQLGGAECLRKPVDAASFIRAVRQARHKPSG